MLRDLVNTQHQNVGVLSAFMTALAGQIYVSPPTTFACLGPQARDWQITIQWFSMGFFFVGINSSIVMASALRTPGSCCTSHPSCTEPFIP